MEENEAGTNYQTRVGALRREKTRMRLIKSALRVFANKGADAPLIDDFIAAAGVARGTFYNYFQTTSELLAAVAGEISDGVLRVIDPVVRTIDDPAMRMVTGVRLYMHMAKLYPLWGAFITRVGTKRGSRGLLLDEYMTRDLQLGIDARRFHVSEVTVARDISLGTIMYGIETLLSDRAPQDYAENMTYSLLLALGIEAIEARSMAFSTLVACPKPLGSIFESIEGIGAMQGRTE
ncbi:TetR/AcrR family transcriptional regulator [Burkholderia sp. S171]|uniref:TetR/AcrR family transcriptional regulator n=1 Tax=Burkholderia sp. S171 TaxID=1641860 RepID=UPI00131A9387|nr:TetR/AcrR family transcriptional regulator [Burkholderia sp. S171]